MAIVIAFITGLLFSAGLIVSGMVNPVEVLGFLDLFGQWDPSLAFVMAGTIAIGVTAFFAAHQRDRSWLDTPIQLPSATGMTARLVLGSVVSGIGWGLTGFYPGPVLVTLSVDMPKAVNFATAMLAGMAVFSQLQRRRQAGDSIVSKPITYLQRII